VPCWLLEIAPVDCIQLWQPFKIELLYNGKGCGLQRGNWGGVLCQIKNNGLLVFSSRWWEHRGSAEHRVATDLSSATAETKRNDKVMTEVHSN
jgi:hypothetical protein